MYVKEEVAGFGVNCNEKKQSFYIDRVVGCYCDHRDFGCDAVACVVEGACQGTCNQLHFEHEADLLGDFDVFDGLHEVSPVVPGECA